MAGYSTIEYYRVGLVGGIGSLRLGFSYLLMLVSYLPDNNSNSVRLCL